MWIIAFEDGRATCFDSEARVAEWLMDMPACKWPSVILRREGEHTWEQMAADCVWLNSERKHKIVFQYVV